MTPPKDWSYRRLLGRALLDAQRAAGGLTQDEVARRLGVTREFLSRSKSDTLPPGADTPARGVGLKVAVEVARMARWSEEQIDQLIVAWTQESVWRGDREHYYTLEMLPEPARSRRWAQLTRIVRDTEGV